MAKKVARSKTASRKRQTVSRTKRAAGRASGHAAHPLMEHEEIRRWAEERGAVPTCVRGTGGRGDTGMIRLEFPRYGEEPKLQPINWDQWFEKFDVSGLVLMVQEQTAGGEKSNFNKLVKRTSAMGKTKPKVRTAG